MSKFSMTLAMIVAVAGMAAAADTPSPKAVQVGIPYDKTVSCTSSVSITELGKAYFSVGTGTLQQDVKAVLDTCAKGVTMEPYKVVVFLARPTPEATQTVAAHFIFNDNAPVVQGSTLLPGIRKAAWIYITADDKDTIVSQLVATPVDNPILAQLAKGWRP